VKKKKEFLQDIHYYLEGERVVFTALFHLERGQCCGSGCRHCPYSQKHKKGTTEVKEEFASLKKSS
jgi:hypothetical protein